MPIRRARCGRCQAKSADNTGCLIEHFGNTDAVPQLPERCLCRKAGIVRCCLKNCGKSGLKYRILSPAAPVLHRRAAGILFCAKNPGNSGQPLA
ncbi:MAG: hypothetical protein ACLUZX_11610 [Subdoligranulum sp.]